MTKVNIPLSYTIKYTCVHFVFMIILKLVVRCSLTGCSYVLFYNCNNMLHIYVKLNIILLPSGIDPDPGTDVG